MLVSSGGMFQNATAEGPGLEPSRGYIALKKSRGMMYASVERCKNYNSVIKCIGKRAPNISLALLSARLMIKSSLGIKTKESGCSSTALFLEAIANGEAMIDMCLRATAEDKRIAASIQDIESEYASAVSKLNSNDANEADQERVNAVLVAKVASDDRKHRKILNIINRYVAPKPYDEFQCEEEQADVDKKMRFRKHDNLLPRQI